MKITILKLIPALCLLFFPNGAGATNPLQNPGFDGDTSGWDNYSGSNSIAEYSIEDAAGNPASGSASVTNISSTGQGSVSGFGQCLPVTEGSWYRFGADVKIPAGQSTTGTSDLTLYYYSQPGCSSYISGDLVFYGSFGEWTGLSGLTQAPTGALSTQVLLNVNKQQAGGALNALFDNVSAEPVLFWDGFETGDTSIWSSIAP